MLAQEHMSYIDALRYGTTRDQTTINAALSAIGSTPAILILTNTGNGIWTLTSNTTIPSNIILYIPAGVTVSRPAGVTLTCNGGVLAYNPAWETGGGSTVRSTTPMAEFSSMYSTQIIVTQPNAPGGILLRGSAASTARQIELYCDQGSGSTGVRITTNASSSIAGWELDVNAGGSLLITRPGGTFMYSFTDTGLGIGSGEVSGGLLQLSADSAFKPGASGLWQVASSRELKTLLGPYTDGLARLMTLPTIHRFIYNGKAHTPTDGREDLGFVAEELQEVAPAMVRSYEATVDADSGETMTVLTTNVGEMIYMFLNAFREVDARLQALEVPSADGPEDEPPTHPRPRRQSR
jgi:hypothetical protein